MFLLRIPKLQGSNHTDSILWLHTSTSCLARPLPHVCERSGARPLNSLQTRHSLALGLQRPSGPDSHFLLRWELDAAGGAHCRGRTWAWGGGGGA